jgi:multidrug resistance efflux pump
VSRFVPALLLLLGATLLAGCGDDVGEVALLPVRRGDLEVVLSLQGNLRPVNERSIKSPSWGEIRSMAENGSMVKAGQIVLELDSERHENALREHQADVKVRTAELLQVEQEVEKSRRRSRLRHAATSLNRQLEESKYKELRARPTKRELIDAASKVAFAREMLKSAIESQRLIAELVKSGFAPREELRAAELSAAKARAELAAAAADEKTVQAGPEASVLQEAAIRVQQSRLSERSAKKNIQIVKEWADAKLARFRRAVAREKEKLAESKRSMRQYRVAAPNDGIVLYAKRRWGGTWQPGRHVWQGATIMSIPDMSRMKIIVQVPADWVRRMDAEQHPAARVEVCALPGRTFAARLSKISTIGRDEFERLDASTSGKLGRAERQVFEAEIELKESDPRLKPGFGARAEIILRRIEDAIIVPRVALVIAPAAAGRRKPGKGSSSLARIYVKTQAGFSERQVELLGTDRFEAAVKGAVKATDLLYPGRPPSIAAAAAPGSATTTGERK